VPASSSSSAASSWPQYAAPRSAVELRPSKPTVNPGTGPGNKGRPGCQVSS
jgi:hypothetical protein